jgi:hypothetical protein
MLDRRFVSPHRPGGPYERPAPGGGILHVFEDHKPRSEVLSQWNGKAGNMSVLSESDTRAKLIDPAIRTQSWIEDLTQREETAGADRLLGG